jgi:hypothetical protein
MLTWEAAGDGVLRADFRLGHYLIEPVCPGEHWYVARWWRGRRAEGENLYGGPSLDAAKAVCERHASRRKPKKAGRLVTTWV